ncbi:hypothetical protein [Reyranella sp.]|uniref:hypothetical protein n=1 Tax=Reyranella sp. TaxID=1929291 RepID=UPI0037835480
MQPKPDLQTVVMCLSKLEVQIGEQKLLVEVLRELGDATEADKAASRLAYLEESYGAVVLYRDLLQEELNKKRRVH